ncbi:MAG TPA: hypothetical protein ENF56_00895 [Candidatus Bathyarchaeota archaeon]|nr:hypothetical protein [Candidatus Bathyarchaeota archaeon]
MFGRPPKLGDFRRIYLFDYKFRESKSLDDILERLKGKFLFLKVKDFEAVIKDARDRGFVPREFKDAAIMRSMTVEPPMVYFVLLQRDDTGGRIMLLETKSSWYTHEKILLSMRAYCKSAGIRCWYVGLGRTV